MTRFLQHLFDFESPETSGHRLFFRLFEVFVVFYVVSFSWEWGSYIQRIDSVLLPLGIANYLDVSFMFQDGISLMNAALITGLAAAALIFRSRYAYIAMLLLFHLQYVSRYSLGEISHGSNLIGMSLLVLALGGLFFSRSYEQRRFVLGGMYFFLGLGYTSAGISKLIGTGLDWPRGEHLVLWIAERQVDTISKFGVGDLNGLQNLIVESTGIGTIVLAFGLVAELLGFMMWWPRYRPYILVVLIGMHLGVASSMNILFDVFIYQLLLFVIPWATLYDGLVLRSARLRSFNIRFLSE